MTSHEAIRILDEQRNKFMDEYVDYGGVNEAYNMAIQALKEQEAVKPVFEVKNPNVVGQFHCGNCHHAFGLLHYKFCPECGRKVKWND